MPYFCDNVNDKIHYGVLTPPVIKRERFDPMNEEHLSSLKKYLSVGKWGDVQFYSEYPYATVRDTVLTKCANFMLGNID